MKHLWLSIAIFFCFFTLLFSHIPVTHAQTNWVDGDYPDAFKEAIENDAVNAPAYNAHTQSNLMADLVRRILGPVEGVTVPIGAIQNDPQYVQRMRQGSAVAGINNYIVAMYANPPADLAYFIRDAGQTLGFIPKQAYAQGIGFSGLAPLLPIWKAFRNIAYVLLAIFMIIIGFMVMLRKKIDPKTVVTVQNSIPRIVITLILITFSYAIAALMVDLMYLLLFLALGILKTTGLVPPLSGPLNALLGSASPEQVFSSGSLISAFTAIFPWGYGSLLDLMVDIFGAGSTATVSGVGALFGALATGGNPIGALAGAVIPSVLGTLLLSLAVLFIFIRLVFMFFSAYISIVLAILVGPLQILFEALPGGTGFSSWIKNLLSNPIVFPIAGVMFMLAYMFALMADPSLGGSASGNIWSPPFLVIGSSPATRSIAAMFSLGFLMVIPSAVNGVKEAIKAKAPLPVGPGVIIAPLSGAYQTGMGAMSQFYYGSQMFGEHSPLRSMLGKKGGNAPHG